MNAVGGGETFLEHQIAELNHSLTEGSVKLEGLVGVVVVGLATRKSMGSWLQTVGTQVLRVEDPTISKVIASGEAHTALLYGELENPGIVLPEGIISPCIRLRTPTLRILSGLCGLRHTWGT